MKLFIASLAALLLAHAGLPAKTSARDAGGEERDAFALRFLAAAQKAMPDAGFRYDAEHFRVIGGGMEYNLYNAFSEYQRGFSSPEDFAAKAAALAVEKEKPGEL